MEINRLSALVEKMRIAAARPPADGDVGSEAWAALRSRQALRSPSAIGIHPR